jgi:hypothetical protein
MIYRITDEYSYIIHNILKIFIEQSYLKLQLSVKTNLDKKTITNIINEMLAAGEVAVVSKITDGIGRPKENLALNGEFSYCIGLDLGGTHVSGVIIDFTGKVLCCHSIDVASMDSDILMQLCNFIIEELLKKSNLTIAQIDKIGLAFPGHIDGKTGEAKLSENIQQWHNIPFSKLFKDRYGKEVMIDDCSRLMALAELRCGAGKESNDFIADIICCSAIFNGWTF